MSSQSMTRLELLPKNSKDNASCGDRLACNKLRVEACDGSPIEDYRIENGQVEKRILDFNIRSQGKGKGEWKRLTREQLVSHVMGNTVVARWLQRRMGVHPLIRACAPPSDAEQPQGKSAQRSHAA